MAEGRRRAEWDQTALLCAVSVNSNPFRKGQPVKPEQFNPYHRKAAAQERPAQAPWKMILRGRHQSGARNG